MVKRKGRFVNRPYEYNDRFIVLIYQLENGTNREASFKRPEAGGKMWEVRNWKIEISVIRGCFTGSPH